MERRVYLESVPQLQAFHRLVEAVERSGWRRGPEEVVATTGALGRVTSCAVFAKNSVPHYHASAMDGVAVRAVDTYGAKETAPLRLRLGQDAFWVDTGDPLPPGCDAVIMVEDLGRSDEETVEITSAAAPWQHVRPIGEDVVVTEMIVPAGHRLRPVDLGALLAAGVLEVPVVRRPRVTIIPTGTELVPPTGDPQPGQIIEFNSRVIAGLIEEWGGSPEVHPIVPDDFGLVREAIARAAESADLVIINAGSSAGSEDFTAAAIGEVGEVLVHGVAIKPGKPVILGLVTGRPVIGLPGYPVSTYLTCNLFVKPLVFRRLGLPAPEPDTVRALLTRRVASNHGVDEFLRVKLGEVGGRLVAVPMPRGAGVITSLVRADGILCIPRESEGLGEGSEVEIALLKERSVIRDTVVVTGSHDITLDLLGSRLATIQPGRTLSTSNVGSLGGIMAIKRREAHLAGVHLMDEETGEYNVSYVRRFLPGQRAVLCHLARRQQGFLVASGNPKGITSFRDLARPDVAFVNRQRGAGTRILLDYYLKREGVDPASINGYGREEFTHLAVAASVAAGSADVGLGILAAARALGLDFVPVAYEEFELLALEEEYRSEKVQRVIEILRTPGFRAEVEALGGYDASDTGRETWVD